MPSFCLRCLLWSPQYTIIVMPGRPQVKWRAHIIGRSNSSNTITAPITNSSDSRTGMQESDTRLRHFPRPSYCCLGATGGRLVFRLRFACHG
ncbi:hypothetical protein CMEL01_08231 [Colletotrichum melonis]|uniref:Uncharacterized protein n=2 Tax=Colletotrichum acutatum species complex TaxID=2707335 RepID=A0AAI9TZL7_9PEZI|nr:uncharacterized protein CTAM01_04840 [Colletotrichum tamarilloi]KAK1448916.1 hypothetical protein CMEL01_08231 [Colletotrichum melonis]KAK1502851.1 hypothetical protein CTAM01_04840 [Colletotrichum tamarilloi]